VPDSEAEGSCMACRANRGELHPPGGVIYDDGLWRLEHMLMPAVLPGWLILKTLRHVESLSKLTMAEAAALGPLLHRATRALELATGADRIYSALFAEAVRHVHFHLIPRHDGVPESAHGPAVFTLPPEATEPACAAIARNVADRLRAHRDTPA
jgi:diadenosine tetraphosphate (Ap4A) HIT family hydrolase